jgi:integrase
MRWRKQVSDALSVRSRALKTANSEATIAMPRALSEALKRWEPYRLQHPPSMTIPPCPWIIPNAHRTAPWDHAASGYKPTDQLRASGERCGLEGITAQSLRRAFSSAAVAAGVPLEIAARQCRHSEEVARQYYVSKEVQGLRDALDGFSYGP